MRAAMTLAPELKTIGDFTTFLLSELTAIGAGLSIGTDRFALGNADIEGFNSIFLCYPDARSAWLSRSPQLPPGLFGFFNCSSRDVSPVGIQLRGQSQAQRLLFLQRCG